MTLTVVGIGVVDDIDTNSVNTPYSKMAIILVFLCLKAILASFEVKYSVEFYV